MNLLLNKLSPNIIHTEKKKKIIREKMNISDDVQILQGMMVSPNIQWEEKVRTKKESIDFVQYT